MSNMWSHEEIDAMRSRISQLKATVDAQDEKERELQAYLAAAKVKVERLEDVLVLVRNYAAGESPDVEEKGWREVFGMIVDLIDSSELI